LREIRCTVGAVTPRASFLLGRPPSKRAHLEVPFQLLAALIASCAGALVIVNADDTHVILGLVGAAGFAAVGMARPALFLSLFLLLRPLLDGINDKHVGAVNAAGAAGVLIVFVLLGQFAVAGRTFRPRGTAVFGLVLALSAVLCLPAVLEFGNRVHSKPFAEIVRLAAMLAVYVLAGQLFATPQRLMRLFTLVGLSGVIPAIIGIKELIEGISPEQGLTIARISGPFTGPNPFGLYLALTAIVLIGLPRHALPRWIRFTSLALILFALVETYSRAGWSLFLIAFVMLQWRRNPRVILAGVATVLLLIAFVPSIHDRVLPPPKSSTATGGVATPESYTFRINNWNNLLGKWAERPVTGFGLQTTVFVNPRHVYDPTGTADPVGYEAHNSAIKLLVEGGVVLLVAWAALIAIVTGGMRRLARRKWPFNPEARTVFALWVGAIVIGLLTDDPLAATAMMYALFALTGALEGSFEAFRRTSVVETAKASAPDHAISR
jgi:O-antigen ligase